MCIVGLRSWLCVLLFAFARAAIPAGAAAAPTDRVTLGWTPSPDARVVGYLLLSGTTSGVYTNQLAVGNTNRATVTGLQAKVTYYFTVVAHDDAGQQSPPSNEIAYTVPADPAASCLPTPAGLVGWWPGDGDANDLAGGNVGTLQGGATASAAGEVGRAFSFDGTNSFIVVPDSPALRPTNFTVETWVRFSSLDSAGNSPAGQQYIIFKQNTRNSSFEGYYLGKQRLAGADTFHFAVSSSAGQCADTASATLVQTGVWYHVAAVRGSDFIQLYVNGRLERQTSVSFPQDYGNFPLYLGSSGQSYWDRKFAGSLDEVSLYNRALGSNDIAAIYLAGVAGKCKGAGGGFLPGGGATRPDGLVGWWPGNGNANDMASGNNGILQGGATAGAVGEVDQAFSLDGTNGYVQIPDSPTLRPTNLTLGAWVRFRSLDSAGSGGSPAGDQYIVFKQNTRSGDFEGFDLSKTRLAVGDVVRFVVTSGSGQVVDLYSQTLVNAGVWYHVAGVRGPNFVQLYVNGRLESEAGVSFPQNYGALPLYFGTSGQPYWDHKLNGVLDEISLYNRALSAGEIGALYAAGSSSASAPATLGRLGILRGGQLSLTLEGGSDRACAIEVSPDLAHWVPFQAVTLSNGAGQVILPSSQPRQFYRASRLP